MHLQRCVYQIRIEGHVHLDWSAWMDDLSVDHCDSGETLISGRLSDQAALHGVLMRIRDLGLVLVEVKRIPDFPKPDQLIFQGEDHE